MGQQPVFEHLRRLAGQHPAFAVATRLDGQRRRRRVQARTEDQRGGALAVGQRRQRALLRLDGCGLQQRGLRQHHVGQEGRARQAPAHLLHQQCELDRPQAEAVEVLRHLHRRPAEFDDARPQLGVGIRFLARIGMGGEKVGRRLLQRTLFVGEVHHSTSNRPAAPMPPPMHIDTTT
ncbi:hypothetical protein MASR2M50_24050 [Thauera sp.]